jgi:hypothetical protein
MLGRDLDRAEPHGPEASAYSNIAGQMRAMCFRQCFRAQRFRVAHRGRAEQ